MSQLRENLVERLKKAYSAYYDIEEIQDGSPPVSYTHLTLPTIGAV